MSSVSLTAILLTTGAVTLLKIPASFFTSPKGFRNDAFSVGLASFSPTDCALSKTCFTFLPFNPNRGTAVSAATGAATPVAMSPAVIVARATSTGSL